jgi:hypothetical protein
MSASQSQSLDTGREYRTEDGELPLYSGIVRLFIQRSAEVHVNAASTAYAAYQSFPNPFNPLLTVRYDIPTAGRVSLQIFDVAGTLVHRFVESRREPGVYSEIWDGRRGDGSALPSGVYFYRLQAGDFVATWKIVLLR